MTTRAHRARLLALSFLRNTECKAIPIDEAEKVLMSVERLGKRLLFHFLPDGAEHEAAPQHTGAGETLPVRFFAEVQDVLERRRWRPGLLDV